MTFTLDFSLCVCVFMDASRCSILPWSLTLCWLRIKHFTNNKTIQFAMVYFFGSILKWSTNSLRCAKLRVMNNLCTYWFPSLDRLGMRWNASLKLELETKYKMAVNWYQKYSVGVLLSKKKKIQKLKLLLLKYSKTCILWEHLDSRAIIRSRQNTLVDKCFFCVPLTQFVLMHRQLLSPARLEDQDMPASHRIKVIKRLFITEVL